MFLFLSQRPELLNFRTVMPHGHLGGGIQEPRGAVSLSFPLGPDLLARAGVGKLLDSGNSHVLGAFMPMRDTSGGNKLILADNTW